MDKIALHPAVSHLGAAELTDLVNRYLAGEKAARLVERFNIRCHANQLRKVLPAKQLDYSCPVCDQPMLEELPKRGASEGERGAVICSACHHEESDACRCRYCVTQRHNSFAQSLAVRRATIRELIVAERKAAVLLHPVPDIDALSLSDAVSFLAFFRTCLSKSGVVYGPLSASAVPYSPTETWSHELMDAIRSAGLVDIDEDSDEYSIDIVDGKVHFDALNVRWKITASSPLKLVEQIEVAGLTRDWPSHWREEGTLMWHQLAMAECRQFYEYCAAERGLHVQAEIAISTMLGNILRDFSVAQCYRIIWNGARNTADFMARERPSRPHAANYMIGSCQRWADLARTSGWAVFPFKRNFNLPRSMISYVLFDVILKVGERGFNQVVGRLD